MGAELGENGWELRRVKKVYWTLNLSFLGSERKMCKNTMNTGAGIARVKKTIKFKRGYVKRDLKQEGSEDFAVKYEAG